MKKLLLISAAAASWAWSAARADLTVVQKVEGLGQAMETTTRYKDGQIRLDVSPGGVSIIVNDRTGETFTLQHAQRSYVRTPSSVVQAAVDGMKPQPQPTGSETKAASPTRPALSATGRKETINGFAAEEYEYVADGARLSLWLTHDVPDYEQTMKEISAVYSHGPLAATTQLAGVDMTHLPGFPVRIVNDSQHGAPLTSTVVSISVKAIDDAEFKVPAGFEEIKTPVLTPPAAASPIRPAR